MKFELALERHHKRLKSRLNRFNFSSDKKYELDDEDCYDDFNYRSILNDENNQKEKVNNNKNNDDNNANLNEIINIKTDYFTNGSQMNIRGNYTTQNEHGEADEVSSSNEEKISDKYNKFVFFNEENLKSENKKNVKVEDSKNSQLDMEAFKNQKILHKNLKNNPDSGRNENNNADLDYINISSITPLNSNMNKNFNNPGIELRKKSKIEGKNLNQNSQPGKKFIMRNDSFNLPRTNSLKYNKK